MRCPFCGSEETQVKDSRPTEDNASIRRRRSCPACEQRFTTFERVQLREMNVIKSGGRRQPFDRDKIIKSMQIALQKRPIDFEKIERVTTGIVRKLESQGEQELESRQIGAEVMQALMDLDEVGYIRYASVYKDFRKPEDFNEFLEDIQTLQDKKSKKAQKLAANNG